MSFCDAANRCHNKQIRNNNLLKCSNHPSIKYHPVCDRFVPMQAPDKIKQLVDTFHNNIDSYKSGQYNETQTRIAFIDPLFEQLGWDMNNADGHAEAYKDVVHEDKVKIGATTRAPDYCFRVGGTRKFFLEAKKPSVPILEAKDPAFQLRRYAWSAKLPLSILTDFEEFAVYDCRFKPSKTDLSSKARTLYFTYDQYEDHWPEIYGTFSKDAVLKGSFDKYVDSNKKKKGTATVDDAFLGEIEHWRDSLAREIWKRNRNLDIRALNDAVQRTIDRIIFLRICEDRGIENYAQLLGLCSGKDTYNRLKVLFHKADDRYNSGLFHFREEKGRTGADNWTLKLSIDDKPIKDIIKRLYYPDSPYEFSVLSADILGQVYEQFLGKIIQPTARSVEIIEKPEVKKAGGVYYTPTYIVDYIVKQTVGELLNGLSPKQAMGKGRKEGHQDPIRVLDPACGSGSFLIGAYQFLLDWYLEHYTQKPDTHTTGKNPKILAIKDGYRLTTAERKRILLDHIYGVDIDAQAVEVTKLSLLLKVLEGESEQSILNQMALFHERALPDLSDNIKCGNSLIGPDFYQNSQLDILDPETQYRINAFDWQNEFKSIFSGDNPGFHAVVGNPPYVRQEGLGEYKNYFERHYAVYHGVADFYTYFIEKGVSMLNEQGIFGYIVMNKWLRANYGKALRQWMATRGIQHIIDFGDLPVFKGATTYPCILLIKQQQTQDYFQVSPLDTLDFTTLTDHVNERTYPVPYAGLDPAGWTLTSQTKQKLLDKLTTLGTPLKEYVDGKIYYGIKTGLNKAFVIDRETRDRLIAEDPKSEEIIKPFALGRDVKRYTHLVPKQYLILFPKGWTTLNSSNAKNAWEWLAQNYPAIAAHLAPFEEAAKKRCDKGEYWWELRACDYYAEFEKGKILWPEIAQNTRFTLDTSGVYANNKVFILPNGSHYLLGLLKFQRFEVVYSFGMHWIAR